MVLLGEGLLELELAEMSLALQLLVFAEGLLGMELAEMLLGLQIVVGVEAVLLTLAKAGLSVGLVDKFPLLLFRLAPN